MNFFNPLQILHRELSSSGRVGHKECIVSIPGRMLLWLEQCIKVPEGALHILVGGHLGEAHLQEYLTELRADFEQGMQVATFWRGSWNGQVYQLSKSKQKCLREIKISRKLTKL